MSAIRFDESLISRATLLLRPLYTKINEVIDNPASSSGNGISYAVVSGTNTYTATLPTLTTGTTLRLLFSNANTSTSTLNGTTLTKQGGATLTSGDIVAGTIYTATYDGSNLQLDIAVVGQWYDWVPTVTGFTASPGVVAARYCLVGKMCTINFRPNTGTSNATTYTLTLPFAAAAAPDLQYGLGVALDSGTAQTSPGMVNTRPSSNIADVYKTMAGGAWTASGNKRFSFSSFTYETL